MNFELSVSHVGAIQCTLQTHVSHAINLVLTARNWLIGYYIVEFEQNGVELRRDRFRYEYASRLNMYLNYYKSEVMQHDDNPPVGILLCTEKGDTLVKYATAGLDPNIFVQKYMIELPTEEEIKDFISKEMDMQYGPEKDQTKNGTVCQN